MNGFVKISIAKTVINLYNSDIMTTWQVQVNSTGKVICAPDWSWDTAPGLAEYDLVTILKGNGTYRIDGEVYPALPGVAMLLRKGQRVIGQRDPDNPMTMIFVHFDFLDSKRRKITPPVSSIPRTHRILDQPAFFHDLLTELYEAFHIQKNRLAADDWLRVILRTLIKQDSRSTWTGYERQQADNFKSLCAKISQSPGSPWRISSLAAEFHCTADHFGRLFQKYIGFSPGEFIIQSRISAANSLLQSSSHPIGQIAEMLGYSDIYAFSRQFRQKTGMTPSACRKRVNSSQK